jgi:phosphatidylglycerol---prolipoprotein diacylglyceryl transferase
MHPVLFGPIKSFGFLLAVSFALGIWLAARRGRKAGIAPETIYDLSFVIFVASIVGVRLLHVLTHLDEYSSNWLKVFQLTQGGLILHGGLVLAVLASWYFCRRRKLAWLRIADLMLPSVALGIGVTRIGCFLAGCCFGTPCDVPWAVHFPPTAPAFQQFGPQGVHPTQLYSSLGGFLIFAALLLWERRSARPGETMGRFMLLYGVVRFSIDFLRYYEPDQRWFLDLSQSQWLSFGLVVTGILILWRAARRRVKSA